MRRKEYVLGLVIALGVLPGAAAAAATLPAPTSAMAMTDAAPTPRGYLAFCLRRPGQCDQPVPTLGAGPRTMATAPVGDRAAMQQFWAVAFSPSSLTATSSAAYDAFYQPASTDPQGFGPQPDLFQHPIDPSAVSKQPPRREALSTTVVLTPTLWTLIKGVNSDINRRIIKRSDQVMFGVSDYWQAPLDVNGEPYGDCEDFVLQKREALIDQGLPHSAVSIAIVATAWGETHAVLLVTTDRGVYVLDNLSPWVVGWQQVSYRWLERQTGQGDLSWARVGEPSASLEPVIHSGR
jgi:predicted transglutaminase-like cysteine proteinase